MIHRDQPAFEELCGSVIPPRACPGRQPSRGQEKFRRDGQEFYSTGRKTLGLITMATMGSLLSCHELLGVGA